MNAKPASVCVGGHDEFWRHEATDAWMSAREGEHGLEHRLGIKGWNLGGLGASGDLCVCFEGFPTTGVSMALREEVRKRARESSPSEACMAGGRGMDRGSRNSPRPGPKHGTSNTEHLPSRRFPNVERMSALCDSPSQSRIIHGPALLLPFQVVPVSSGGHTR